MRGTPEDGIHCGLDSVRNVSAHLHCPIDASGNNNPAGEITDDAGRYAHGGLNGR